MCFHHDLGILEFLLMTHLHITCIEHTGSVNNLFQYIEKRTGMKSYSGALSQNDIHCVELFLKSCVTNYY